MQILLDMRHDKVFGSATRHRDVVVRRLGMKTLDRFEVAQALCLRHVIPGAALGCLALRVMGVLAHHP